MKERLNPSKLRTTEIFSTCNAFRYSIGTKIKLITFCFPATINIYCFSLYIILIEWKFWWIWLINAKRLRMQLPSRLERVTTVDLKNLISVDSNTNGSLNECQMFHAWKRLFFKIPITQVTKTNNIKTVFPVFL